MNGTIIQQSYNHFNEIILFHHNVINHYEYYLKKIGKGLVQLISKGYLVVYNDIECLSG